MRLLSLIPGTLAVFCAAGIALPSQAADVSDEDFKALKDMVIKQGQRLDQLQQQHPLHCLQIIQHQ